MKTTEPPNDDTEGHRLTPIAHEPAPSPDTDEDDDVAGHVQPDRLRDPLRERDL